VDDIVESIKRALINGDLEPGQRLPSENELAQSLEVGRNAVREAMKMLSALGIVNINGEMEHLSQRNCLCSRSCHYHLPSYFRRG